MINSRAKGISFEQRIARSLRAWPGLDDMRRGLTQSRGAIEPDIIADNWPFWTELKHKRCVDVPGALGQATNDLLATVERRLLGEAIGENPLAYRSWAGPMVIARDNGGDVFFAARHFTLTSNSFGPSLSRLPLSRGGRCVIGKSVFTLISVEGWRNFRTALCSFHDHHKRLVVVRSNGAPPVLVGWLEALERLWLER